jgi:hypothetical protein
MKKFRSIQGLITDIFKQNIHIPSFRVNPLPNDHARMIAAARKYQLEVTALSISRPIQLQMPIWNHISMMTSKFDKIHRKEALKCLRNNHSCRTVNDVMTIAHRNTVLPRQPHSLNPSGIARQKCGCPLCRRDRIEFGCANPGVCVELAKMLLDCVSPKWNPCTPQGEDLILTDEERAKNEVSADKDDSTHTFDPMFRLTDMAAGFWIFASEEHTTQIETKRYRRKTHLRCN